MRQRESINILAPGGFEWILYQVIFKQGFVIDGWDVSCEVAKWMSVDLTDDKSGYGFALSGNKPLPE